MVVSKIRNGTVIDHIEAGQALNVARILKISPKDKVLIAMNVFSEKYCKKDILKIEDRELKGNEVELIA
ncbi:MAG TPA: aspartate carbamoyltransferase regulatory subunit, partial [Euryarchaeota archaeon]|nr:aspartate carbamoyltransferase regulatory subunit [Euryarchaeota archaeon]